MMKNIQTNVSFMVVQRLSMVLAVGACALLAQVANADTMNSTTMPVDLAGINTTKHEIAVMQVLSEICPPMLDNQQKQKFYKKQKEQKNLLF